VTEPRIARDGADPARETIARPIVELFEAVQKWGAVAVAGYAGAGRLQAITDAVDQVLAARDEELARLRAENEELHEAFAIEGPVSADEHEAALKDTAGVLAELSAAQRAIVWLDDFSGAGACSDTPDDVAREIARARAAAKDEERAEAIGRRVIEETLARFRAGRPDAERAAAVPTEGL
jgi:hypothetical protein